MSSYAHAQDNLQSLESVPLANLGNIVTSVSKKPEDSFRSPAAIFVITNEDIKLSGATHVAEVLRIVPGLDVARIDSSNWAISSRGFNDLFANKLLVLIDGRTIYTPLFSGVYWDIQNIPLEDIDRIEVIRGPGAALWGANAVNGIINIITKNASETQGVYASTVAGNEDRSLTTLRYGGKLGDSGYYRSYAQCDFRDSTTTVDGADGGNDWHNLKAGFRGDWAPSDTRKITVQGDAYDSDINLDLSVPSFSDPTGVLFRHDTIRSSGFNLLGRWNEQHSSTIQSTLQAYFDHQSPDYSSLHQDIGTIDVDYQTEWKINDRHDLMWGAGTRFVSDELTGSFDIGVPREIHNYNILSAFAQDQVGIIPETLYLTLGSKLEHNSFSGFEIEPSVRLAWSVDNRQTLWTAVSRAVRTPSIIEESSTINALTIEPGVIAQQQSNPNFDSEDLVAYEVGYRIKPAQSVSLDTAVFYNHYQNLATFEPGEPIVSEEGGVFVPFQISNLGKGHAYGFEASATWDVTSRWNLLTSYTHAELELEPGLSQDPTFEGQEGKTPLNQAMLRSQLFLPDNFRLVNAGYYVSDLSTFNVDDYFRFDTQVIYQAAPNLELALVGQNLFDDKHQEFGAPLNGAANEIPRAFYGRISFRY